MKKKYVKAFIDKVLDEEYCLTAKDFETARKLSVSKDELVRTDIACLLALYENDISESILYDMTFDKSSLVRVNAVDSIGLGKRKDSFDRVYHLMQYDRVPIVRSYAVLSQYDVFEKLADKPLSKESYIGELINCLNRETRREVRISYYEVLCCAGEKSFFDDIIGCIQKEAETGHFVLLWSLLHSIERLLEKGSIEKSMVKEKLEPLIQTFPKQQKLFALELFQSIDEI